MTKPDVNNAFRERLAEAIEEAPAKQYQIAEYCHVSEQAVGRWKRTGKISRENLLSLSQISGYRYRWIKDGAGPKKFTDSADNLQEYRVAEEPTSYEAGKNAISHSPAAQRLLDSLVFALANGRISEAAIDHLSKFINAVTDPK